MNLRFTGFNVYRQNNKHQHSYTSGLKNSDLLVETSSEILVIRYSNKLSNSDDKMKTVAVALLATMLIAFIE